ncbi:hypothetical protein FNJ84_15220 [Paracoccus sp. M683]|uniref:hypothetical protein n=1 Tax=Paracoccus sp. M683 TaxID=2594268 RepID=UPI00117D374A|nr:hypothetical protein [Paracoccus sp. M683]TRW95732.1 hypothetical protein FNJ84_15220 [Paracoccus sp. M683]
MKRIYALPLIALLAAAPFALAQTDDPAPETGQDYGYTPPLADDPAAPPDGSTDEGADLIGRGMGMLFQNLLNDMAPEIDGLSQSLGDALAMLGPAVSDLSVLVDDIGNYQTPERLENGDIIIRRKPGAPPPPALGEGLGDLGRDRPGTTPEKLPVDPYQPQIEL